MFKSRLVERDKTREMVLSSADIWATTGACPIVLDTRDESTCHLNDDTKRQWMKQNGQLLRKKG